MKKFVMVAALALIAAPALAEDLSQDALAKLGLAGMQQMSDEAGQEVRGSQLSMTGSISTISGVLFDPETKSFANFASGDWAMLEADLTMANDSAFSTTGYSINLVLAGPTNTSSITGATLGAALNGIGNTNAPVILPPLAPIFP